MGSDRESIVEACVMAGTLTLHAREFIYIDHVVRALASGGRLVPESMVESILGKMKSLDFEHSMLALALASNEGLLERACKTVTSYDEHGLMLRYANVDSYMALLLYMIESGRHKLIKGFSKCGESLAKVLEKSLDDLDKLDRDIAKIVLDVFRERLKGGDPSRVISSSKALCSEYVNSGEKGFCMLAVATIASLAGVNYDLGEIVEYEKQITEYIQDLEKTDQVPYTTLKYYIIKRKGEEILKKGSLNFRDLKNRVEGVLYVLVFVIVWWLGTYLIDCLLAIFPFPFNQLHKTLLVFGISITSLIPTLVRRIIQDVSILITSLLFRLERWIKQLRAK